MASSVTINSSQKERPIFGCGRCGKIFTTIKNNFPPSYSPIHKGTGALPVCKDCLDAIYANYYKECRDEKAAVRQVCRKLDIFWSDAIYNHIASKASTRSMMSAYIQRSNTAAYIGKCYDDTLINEGTLWNFAAQEEKVEQPVVEAEPEVEEFDIPEDVRVFWGSGYTSSMYHELEQRRSFWMKKLGDIELDAGTEALIRQICSLELDINRDRAAGKPVDKSVAALNNLLGSAMLKPSQKKEDIDSAAANTPLGVWLYRYEYEKPLPDIDESLKDENKIKKYIFTWMGHVCKVVGLKNGYTRMYEKEIERLRVERPEYEDDDDETLIDDIFGEDSFDDDDE